MIEPTWHQKTVALVNKHNLGFWHNPGGGEFVGRDKAIRIQIHCMDDKEDYERLLKGLKRLGFERD